MKVLITGGAGFIGAKLAKKLTMTGYEVTILDNLSEQVHGADNSFPEDLRAISHCVKGDVRDRSLMSSLILDKEVIVHLAAETGTGQSMYDVERYEDVNIHGTAVLLDILVNERPTSLRKLVVASSRAIYGEGRYNCLAHGNVYPEARTAYEMSMSQFEPVCPVCKGAIQVMPTPEDAPLAPSSFYGLTKQMQEQMVLLFAKTLGIDGLALRYQNVYGPGQSLSNPYTGILAVFSNLARQGNLINIFEDGEESRDFIYIDDVVEATAACIAQAQGVYALNVGSGVRTSVIQVAQAIINHFGTKNSMKVTGAFRVGDIRHNVADISKLTNLTSFTPKWAFEDGLRQFLLWAECQQNGSDSDFERSLNELKERGLFGEIK